MESRTITVEGLRTRVLVEEGRGAEREPIVLIHGVGGWAENWRPVIAALAATGRQVIAIDLPGFGQSEMCSASNERTSRATRWVARSRT